MIHKALSLWTWVRQPLYVTMFNENDDIREQTKSLWGFWMSQASCQVMHEPLEMVLAEIDNLVAESCKT